MVFEAGLLPGVFYVGVGRHGFKDLLDWSRVVGVHEHH